MQRFLFTCIALLSLLTMVPRQVKGNTWDLNLGRLCQIETVSGNRLECGGGYSTQQAKSDPLNKIYPDNAAFRSLMSELGAVFAPNILSPADTRGYSGFSASAQLGWTMINPKRSVQDQQFKGAQLSMPRPYWRAAQSVSAEVFNNPQRTDIETMNSELPPDFAPTITLMASKGLWLPIPSFEIGLGVRHLIGSKMWAPLATAKIALHEGYHDWPIPSLAVRGTGAHVMGTSGFHLSLAGFDLSVSKQVGIASLFNLTPYIGYQLLWLIADSEVIDATPGVNAMTETFQKAQGDVAQLNQCWGTDCKGNFSFANQSNITRHRLFLGLRANFYLATLSLEYTYFASGGKSDEIAAQANIPNLVIPDGSGSQHSISFALALDY